MNGDEQGRSPGDREALRAAAVAMRRAGRSRREIATALGLRGNRLLGDLLRGEPPPAWTRRPNAKDDLRARARELRSEGRTYREIAQALGVSIGTCSVWLRDIPPPTPPEPGSHEQERVAAMWRARWDAVLAEREVARSSTRLAAARRIGKVDRRDLLIAGAIAYWCEGSKDKSYARRERVVFMNSDPELIRLFVRFLDAVGVEPGRRAYRLHIHETADVGAATGYWADLLGVDPNGFDKPLIKRHSPKTNRRNLREEYQGCLQITVRKSAELYRQITGWVTGTIVGAERADLADGEPGVED